MACYHLNSKIYYQPNDNNNLSHPIDYAVKSFAYHTINKTYYIVNDQDILHIYDKNWKLIHEIPNIKQVVYRRSVYNCDGIFAINSDNKLIRIKSKKSISETMLISDFEIKKVISDYESVFVIDMNNQVWAMGTNFWKRFGLEKINFEKLGMVPLTNVINIASGKTGTIFMFEDDNSKYFGLDIYQNKIIQGEILKNTAGATKACMTTLNKYFLLPQGNILCLGPQIDIDNLGDVDDMTYFNNRIAILCKNGEIYIIEKLFDINKDKNAIITIWKFNNKLELVNKFEGIQLI